MLASRMLRRPLPRRARRAARAVRRLARAASTTACCTPALDAPLVVVTRRCCLRHHRAVAVHRASTSELTPPEDRAVGDSCGSPRRRASSLDYTAAKMREIEERTAPLRASGEVVGLFSIAGAGGQTTAGFMIFTLAPWGERDARPAGDRRRHRPGRPARSIGVRAFARPAELARHPRRRAGAAVRARRLELRGARRGQPGAGRADGGRPGLPAGAGLLRDHPAAALHRGRPRARLRPRHRHRRARRDAAGGARRPLGRLGLHRRPQLRHQAHLDHRPGARPGRPREPVPGDRRGRDGADVHGRDARGAADRAGARPRGADARR